MGVKMKNLHFLVLSVHNIVMMMTKIPSNYFYKPVQKSNQETFAVRGCFRKSDAKYQKWLRN